MTVGIIAGVVGIIGAAICYWKRDQIWDGIKTCYCPNNDEHRPLNEHNNFVPPAENKKKNLRSERDNVTV